MARRLLVLLFLLTGPWSARAALAVVAGTSAVQNPRASFATPGVKQVTLTSCNAGGCTTVTKSITVLDPTPVVDQATVGGLTFTAGQLVRLSGAAHGRPPLAYTWRVHSLGPEVDISGAAAWWDTSAVLPGAYAIDLLVQNTDGTAISVPVPVVVAADAGMGFYTLAPCRVLDTRSSLPLASNVPLVIPVAGAAGCGVPASARAVAINVTVASPTAAGVLTLYPGNYLRPVVSTVNFSAGETRANSAILALASDNTGALAAAATVGTSGTVHLIVDIDGYFQ
jgi:PKD repeat protein